MKTPLTLSIIIVSYNTKQLTLQTINSVVKDFNQAGLSDRVEILVVDNNSSDGSLEALAKEDVQLIKNKQNLGFAKANNQAIRLATGDIIWLLNSDTIVQAGCIKTIIDTFAKHPLGASSAYTQAQRANYLDRLGVVGAGLQSASGEWQNQGGSMPTLLSVFFQMSLLDDLPLIGQYLPSTQTTKHLGKDVVSYGWVAGTAMAVRREVFAEIGLLDENIFMYSEDAEFCLRARKHHWDIVVQPQAKVTHLGSASSSSAKAIKGEFLGMIYIWAKHKPLWQKHWLKLILYLGAYLRIFLFGTITRQPARAKIYRQLPSLIGSA